MHPLRRVVACAWLVCQLIAVASPLALACDRFGIDQATCCTDVGPGQICPMHHHGADDHTCRMERVCGHRDASLLTIVPVGVLPPAEPSSVSTIVSPVDAVRVSTASRAFTPDLPPPRRFSSAAL